MSFGIAFGELRTYAPESGHGRPPLSDLPADGCSHIHGRLQIMVNGRPLPHLGCFSPNDACFNEWFRELCNATAALATSDPADYTYDEGEEGQPAFRFSRRGGSLLVSVIDSKISDGRADPEWQDVECGFAEFIDEVAKFSSSFREVLLSQSPVGGTAWLRNVLPGSA